jgi:hypothetical protein
MNSMARRMFELVEPIGVIPYSADEPNEAMFALGFTNYANQLAALGVAQFRIRGLPDQRIAEQGDLSLTVVHRMPSKVS